MKKATPRTVEEAPTLAIELDSFNTLKRTNYRSSARQSNFSVSQIDSASPQSETIDEMVRSLRNAVETADETITRITNPEIRDRIITDEVLLIRIYKTSNSMVTETIISQTQTATIPIDNVNHVVSVDDQITFQTNANYASIANALDNSDVIAWRPEPIRWTKTVYASGS